MCNYKQMVNMVGIKRAAPAGASFGQILSCKMTWSADPESYPALRIQRSEVF